MKRDDFYYLAEAEWAGGNRGNLRFPNLPAIEVAPPPEFAGPGSGWTPEGLYVGAVASCFLLTFLAFALRSKLELSTAIVSAEGKLEKDPDGGYRFTEVTVRPVVVVERAAEKERAERLLRKAEQSCFIAASVKSGLTMLPQVYHKQLAPPSEAAAAIV
jgi:peroxiredoxin-like protein